MAKPYMKKRTLRKRSSLKKAKDSAWEWFSKYIRWKYADMDGSVRCVTCGVIKDWKEMQAGHFVGGRGNTVLFDEGLVHPQCVGCNVFLNGNYAKYTVFMMKKYGYTAVEIEGLLALRKTARPLKTEDFKRIRDEYFEKAIRLDVSGNFRT